jgi:hypothetical protein
LKYELASLDSFIEANFNPDHLLRDFSEESDFKSKLIFIRNERERIRFDLMNDAFLINDDLKCQYHIQHHQKALVFLINKLGLYQRALIGYIGDFLLSDFILLFQELYDCIFFLLDFFEKYFNQYFDFDLVIPDISYSYITCQINYTLFILQSFEFCEDDAPIYNLISEILKNDLKSEREKYTYRYYRYIKVFLLLILEMPNRIEFELMTLNF